MTTRSVRQAFRIAGVPVVLLTLLCAGMGMVAWTFDPGAAVAFLIAGAGALTIFLLLADVIVPPGAPGR